MKRNTNQRKVILDALRDSRSHLTADEVYVRSRNILPNVSLGTVYRNLSLLSDSGEVLLIRTPGGSAYFDGNTTPHKHMLCKNCGKLIDIPEENCKVTISELPGAEILGYDLLVYCTCEECLALH